MNNNKILWSCFRAEHQELLLSLWCDQLITPHCLGLRQEISLQAAPPASVPPGCLLPPPKQFALAVAPHAVLGEKDWLSSLEIHDRFIAGNPGRQSRSRNSRLTAQSQTAAPEFWTRDPAPVRIHATFRTPRFTNTAKLISIIAIIQLY